MSNLVLTLAADNQLSGATLTDSTTYRLLSATDPGNYITFDNASAIEIEVDSTFDSACSVGDTTCFRRAAGAGAFTLTETGVTINGNAAASVQQGGNFLIRKVDVATYDFIG